MSRFPLSRLPLTAAGLLLLGGPLAAAPAAPIMPKAAPALNPQVKALLNQTVAAQQALTALTATLSITTVGTPQADPGQTIMLSLDKSLGANAAISDPTGPLSRIVSDKKSFTTYDVHAKTYLTRALPAGSPAGAVLAFSGSVLAQLIVRPEALNQIATQHVTTTLGASTTVGAVVCDTMTLTPLASGSGSQTVITVAVGHDDHLLRQISFVVTLPVAGAKAPKIITHTETVTALSTTPTLTAADFTFTPPAGVKKQVAQAEPLRHDPRLVPGARPFAVTAKDLSGKPISLAQYRGKVVLMDFWATWCGPCVGEMPNVIANYKKYHAQGFDIVGVSLDQDKGALTSYIAKNKMPWRQIFDGKGWASAVGKQYGVQSIPFGLLIGRDGKIVALEVRGPALGPAIAKALAAKPALAKAMPKKTMASK